jgi:hypothetical protein
LSSPARTKRIALILAVVAAAGAALAWVLSVPRPRYTEAQWQALGLAGDPAAGRLLFFAGGCESCHKSPGQDDPLRLGGGLELPFGSFYPPNISSDPVDGIGTWRPVDVANALMSSVATGLRAFECAFSVRTSSFVHGLMTRRAVFAFTVLADFVILTAFFKALGIIQVLHL